MKKKILFFTAQFMVFVFLISSCRKEIPPPPIPTPDVIPLPSVIVGQIYGGGIVFYIDKTGHHGLITDTTTQTKPLQWSNGSFIETSARGSIIGTGQENTTAAVNNQGVGIYAANICYQLDLNGYNDWFLPSKDELNILYYQKAAGKVGAFVNDFYWSSTECSTSGAWSQSFINGANSSANKDGTYYVRAIRAF